MESDWSSWWIASAPSHALRACPSSSPATAPPNSGSSPPPEGGTTPGRLLTIASASRSVLQLFVHHPDALAQVLDELQQDLRVLVDERLQPVPAQHAHRRGVTRLRAGRPRLVVEHRHLADHRARPQTSQRDLAALVVEVDADLSFEHYEQL